MTVQIGKSRIVLTLIKRVFILSCAIAICACAALTSQKVNMEVLEASKTKVYKLGFVKAAEYRGGWSEYFPEETGLG
jgi:hypothetical protein